VIKINLALKKQSSAASSAGGGGGGGFLGAGVGRIDFRLDGIKELPVKKIASALLACIVLTYFFEGYKEDEVAKVDVVLTELRAEVNRLQAETGKIKGFDVLKKQLDSDEFILKSKIETIEKLVADRTTPPKLLMALSAAMPAEVWLSSLRIQDGEVTLAGGSVGFNQISDLMKNLNENIYFSELTLKKTEQSKDKLGREFAEFELTAKRR